MKEACCSINPKLRERNQQVNRTQNVKAVSLGMKQDIFQSLGNQIKGDVWLEGLFGIEKENIRVDKAGNLSQTPHPKVFGN